MIETDYIMRMIGLLATFLSRLFFLKRAKEFPQALAEIDRTAKSLLGVDRNMIRRFSPAQFMEFFGSDQTLALPKRYVLGVLLKEEASILYQERKLDESAVSALKSLDLLMDTLLKSGNTLDPAHEKHLIEAVDLLGKSDLAAESQERLFACYELLGRFDRAENLLFELLLHDARFLESGRLFYERLLAKSDDDLIRGKLPRLEVEEGVRELQRRFGCAKR